MKWLFIADVGGSDTFHVGDEAMLSRNLAIFRDLFPDSDFTVVSRDPIFTAKAYGVAGVPGLGFKDVADRTQCEVLLARSLTDPPSLFQFFAQDDTGLVISGGGNLASTWFPQIYERLALARAAVKNDRPVVILGQTIGPELSQRDAELVSELLTSARWIGVREPFSYALATRLGISTDRLSYQTDDALFIDPAPLPIDVERLLSTTTGGWIAVTIHPIVNPTENRDLICRISREIEKIGQLTGCDFVFVPHAAAAPDVGASFGDIDIAHALLDELKQVRFCVLPLLDASQVRQVYNLTEMVISTRYHPLVFSLAAGRPCIGIHTDYYTDVKLSGALLHYGRELDICSWEDALQGKLLEICRRTWLQRSAIARELCEKNNLLRQAEGRRFGRLAETVKSGAATAESSDSVLRGVCNALTLPRREYSLPALVKNRELEGIVQNAALYTKSLEESRTSIGEYVQDLTQRLAAVSASLHDATSYARSLSDARDKAEKYAESLRIAYERLANERRTGKAD